MTKRQLTFGELWSVVNIPVGGGLSIGVEQSDRREFEQSTDILLAYQLQTLTLREKGDRVQNSCYAKGAML